jgi:hypothetical protein
MLMMKVNSTTSSNSSSSSSGSRGCTPTPSLCSCSSVQPPEGQLWGAGGADAALRVGAGATTQRRCTLCTLNHTPAGRCRFSPTLPTASSSCGCPRAGANQSHILADTGCICNHPLLLLLLLLQVQALKGFLQRSTCGLRCTRCHTNAKPAPQRICMCVCKAVVVVVKGALVGAAAAVHGPHPHCCIVRCCCQLAVVLWAPRHCCDLSGVAAQGGGGQGGVRHLQQQQAHQV